MNKCQKIFNLPMFQNIWKLFKKKKLDKRFRIYECSQYRKVANPSGFMANVILSQDSLLIATSKQTKRNFQATDYLF